MYIKEKPPDTASWKNKIRLIPIVIAVSIIPLVVRMKVVSSSLQSYSWFANETSNADLFIYFKSVWITILAFIMLIIICFKLPITLKTKKITYCFIPLFIYQLFIILSTFMSKDKNLSLYGSYEQFETTFVLLGYGIFALYTFLTIKDESDIKFIIKWWLVSIFILCLIGVSQVFGFDFFATTIGKKIITPMQYWDTIDQMVFNFGKGRVYLTLYNPNYVGVYAVLACPILSVLLVFDKNIRNKIILGFLLIGMIVAMIGSQSKSAFITLGILVIISCFIFIKKIIKYWKYSLSVLVVGLVILFGVGTYTNYSFIDGIKSAFNISRSVYNINKINTNADQVIIQYKENELHMSYTNNDDNYKIDLTDSNGNTIETAAGDPSYKMNITDERFVGITVEPAIADGTYGVLFTIDSVQWMFAKTGDDNTYYYYNQYGKWDKIYQPLIFNIPEQVFSGRGYIWSRTMPLLKKYTIIGSGPDTFTLVFPQDDYVGLQNNGFAGYTITKPHNLYFQIGVQTGIISLIMFILFYLIYFVESLKLYLNNTFASFYEQIGIAIFLSTSAYMMAGISNDSTVVTAPIFWVLMGLGKWINYKCKLGINKVNQNLSDSALNNIK